MKRSNSNAPVVEKQHELQIKFKFRKLVQRTFRLMPTLELERVWRNSALIVDGGLRGRKKKKKGFRERKRKRESGKGGSKKVSK